MFNKINLNDVDSSSVLNIEANVNQTIVVLTRQPKIYGNVFVGILFRFRGDLMVYLSVSWLFVLFV